jgi:hypothetical protein
MNLVAMYVYYTNVYSKNIYLVKLWKKCYVSIEKQVSNLNTILYCNMGEDSSFKHIMHSG